MNTPKNSKEGRKGKDSYIPHTRADGLTELRQGKFHRNWVHVSDRHSTTIRGIVLGVPSQFLFNYCFSRSLSIPVSSELENLERRSRWT